VGGKKSKRPSSVAKWGEPSWSTNGSELTGLESLFMGESGWGKPAWSGRAPLPPPEPEPTFRRGRGGMHVVEAPVPSATRFWGQPYWSDVPPPPPPAPPESILTGRGVFSPQFEVPVPSATAGWGQPYWSDIPPPPPPAPIPNRNRSGGGRWGMHRPRPINPILNWGLPSWGAPRPLQSGGIVNAMPRNNIPGHFPGGTNHGYRR